MVEPLGAIICHSVANESIEFVDVGEAQLVKVLLTLQTFNRNWTEQVLWFSFAESGVFTFRLSSGGAVLTNAEEKQGLHAQELLLSDLQQQELLGNVSHP